jgi:hypothetical protein
MSEGEIPMVTMSDIQEFAAFAGERISRGDVTSLAALAAAWEEERELRSTVEAIQQSVADYEAGRVKPVVEAFASVREKLGWTK